MQDINLFVAELSYLRPLCIIIINLLVSNNSTMTEEDDGWTQISSYCSIGLYTPLSKSKIWLLSLHLFVWAHVLIDGPQLSSRHNLIPAPTW